MMVTDGGIGTKMGLIRRENGNGQTEMEMGFQNAIISIQTDIA